MITQINQGKIQSLLSNIGNIKSSVNALRSLGDPNKALEQLIQGSPQMKQALDYVNSHGGNPKEACYGLLKEEGIDPAQIEQALK